MADPGVLNTLPLEGSNPSTPTTFASFNDFAHLTCESIGKIVDDTAMWPREVIDDIWPELAKFVGESFW